MSRQGLLELQPYLGRISSARNPPGTRLWYLAYTFFVEMSVKAQPHAFIHIHGVHVDIRVAVFPALFQQSQRACP